MTVGAKLALQAFFRAEPWRPRGFSFWMGEEWRA